jgi:hypothetical protein
MPYRLTALVVSAATLIGGTFWLLSPLGGSDPAPREAWAKVQPHLDRFDKAAEEARERRLDTLRDFLSKREKRTPRFAEEVLSWGGKWALIKQTVGVGEADGHRKYLAEAFGRHVLSGEELQAEITRTVRGYLSDLEALENDMLVQLRADLADLELGRGVSAAVLSSDATFLEECHRLEAELEPALSRELGVAIGREVASFVAMDVTTQVVIRVAEAVAVELGVSAGVLSAGAASTVATLGVGLVVGVVIDALLGELLRVFGHDPEREIGERAAGQVRRLSDLLIDGEAAARGSHERLLAMGNDDWYPPARAAGIQAALSIENSGRLGLRGELTGLHRLRSKLRTEALRKLVSEGGLK